jgi:voltage-gated potassium channel
MSVGNGPVGRPSRWQAARLRWRELERLTAWQRWYPHVLIAAVLAFLGLLLVLSGGQRALGEAPQSARVLELEQHLNPLHYGPVLELAVGVSLLAISVGIALRSRLAWMWSLAALGVGLSLRIPPGLGDAPFVILIGVLFSLLVLYRGRFTSRTSITSGVFAVTLLVTFFTWATGGTLRLGEQFDPPVRDLPTALYFSVVTASSVGFGDIVATGQEARLFVTAMIGIGIVIGATALSTILLPLIGSRMREILGGRPHVERSNHFVIVGKSPLARNAALELEKRKRHVTLILDRASEEEFYRQRDVVVGDPTDLAVLRSAGAEHAKGVLALSPDDAENGFVVLGVNEIDATIPTVAALNDPANQFRLKRSQPSLLLSLQALGGQLLAMALTGERVDLEMLTRVLQVHGAESENAAAPEREA